MIKVLVVDDLFFMRSLISDILNSDPEIKVIGAAKDGKDALEKIPRLKPDVITLDLSMPGMDGLTALQEIMNRYPTPVVILSAHESRKEADIVLKCLHEGAVSFVFKPSKELSLDIEKVKHQLLQEVKAVAAVDMKAVVQRMKQEAGSRKQDNHASCVVPLASSLTHAEQRVVVIGASTGGPQTLEAILSVIPSNFPFPIIVAQHVPGVFFSQSLAKRLNSHCRLNVKVAEDGEVIQDGKVYIVPFGFSMEVRRQEARGRKHEAGNKRQEAGGTKHEARSTKQDNLASCFMLRASLSDHAPSIDETMMSLAKVYHKNIMGIILTGIGSDGVEGMKAIRQNGGKTIAQDESALINGMPSAVIKAGLADEVLSLTEISRAIMEFGENEAGSKRQETGRRSTIND